MGFIKISPEAVRQHASEIKTLSGKMQETMDTVNTAVKALRADWQDAVHETFDADFAQLKQAFDTFVQSIPEYANEAIRHADEMERIGH